MDAHGKNFSLLHKSSEHILLAPFYDIICTQVYPTLTEKMAMKIGSKYIAKDVFPRHWQQLCEQINYRFPAMVLLLQKLGTELPRVMSEEKEQLIKEGIDHPIIDKINIIIQKNIERVLEQF